MRNDLKATALLVLALPVMGGCQSLFGITSAKTDIRPVQSVGMSSHDGDGFLEDGRKALSEGRYAAAIDAFRFARLSPESAAAAYNGMAVAYSQLGRQDLTERFFRRAIVLAPEDERYRRNLARFMDLNPIAIPAEARPENSPTQARGRAVAAAPAEPRSASGLRPGAPVHVEQPATRMVAVGEHQLLVSAVPNAKATRQFARLRVSGPGQTGSSYPVRLTFSDPTRVDAKVSGYRRKVALKVTDQ